MIERISDPMVIINPKLLDNYHCALITAAPCESCQRFSKQDVQNIFENNFNVKELSWSDLLKKFLICFENPFVEIKDSVFLFYHSDLEKLKMRASTLAYLFNQKVAIIYPKQQTEVREILRINDDKPFGFRTRTKPFKSIEQSSSYLLGLQLAQQCYDDAMTYRENDEFRCSSIMSKMAISAVGNRIEKKLEAIYASRQIR